MSTLPFYGMLTESENSCLRRSTNQTPRVLGPTAMGYVRSTIGSVWILTGVEEVVVALGVAGRIKHQFENMVFLDHFLQFEDIMIIHHTGVLGSIGPDLEKRLTMILYQTVLLGSSPAKISRQG